MKPIDRITTIAKLSSEINEQELQTYANFVNSHNDIIILGNGGSSSIASHISQDYTKKLGKRAITFSDSSQLTCYANDYGWHQAYAYFLRHYAKAETLVVLISSSGESENIINAALAALEIGCPLVALSGFSQNNSLRTKIDWDFHYWVNSSDYGVVECMHQNFLHSIC